MSVVRATAVPVPVAGVHTRRIQRRTGRGVVWRGVWRLDYFWSAEIGRARPVNGPRSYTGKVLLVRYYAVSTVVD